MLMRDLAQEGRIAMTEVSTAEIEESQTHRIAFGDFSYAYANYLRKLGRFVPDLKGPNLVEHRPVSDHEVRSSTGSLRRN